MGGWTRISLPDTPFECWKCRHDGMIYTAVRIGGYVEISDELNRIYLEPGKCTRFDGAAIWDLMRIRETRIQASAVIS